MLRKMCRYMSEEWLRELCEEAAEGDQQRPPFAAVISEVLTVVVENEVSGEDGGRGGGRELGKYMYIGIWGNMIPALSTCTCMYMYM